MNAALAILLIGVFGVLAIEIQQRVRIERRLELRMWRNVAALGLDHEAMNAERNARHAANENSKQANLYGHFAPPVMGE